MERKQEVQDNHPAVQPPLFERLVRLAERAAADGRESTATLQLLQAVELALQQGEDNAIGQARRHLADEPQTLLRRAACIIAADSRRLDRKRGLLQTAVMLIPAYLHCTGEVPARLPNVRAFAASFKNSVFAPRGTRSVPFLLSGLYRLDDLAALSYSRIYRLLKSGEAFFMRQRTGAVPRLPLSPSADPAPHRRSPGHTRYLVGICEYDALAGVDPFDDEAVTDDHLAWMERAAARLEQQLPGPHLVLPPQPFFSGLDNELLLRDLDAQRMQAMRDAIDAGLAAAGIDAGRVYPYYSFHSWDEGDEEHDQIRIAGFADNVAGPPVFTFVWELAVPELVLVSFDRVTDVLIEYDFPLIHHVPDTLPAELCDCCGQPKFRGPLREEDLARAGVLIHSQAIH